MGWHSSLQDALNQLPGAKGKRFASVFKHGTLNLLVYAPRGTDPQTLHQQDEVYVVVKGAGKFILADAEFSFGEGDLIFVPAGTEHCFVDFSEDLAVWVIFYGPPGGE
jgi:mannose-6-phosphate isomerase-like protein (cupin superfamily)